MIIPDYLKSEIKVKYKKHDLMEMTISLIRQITKQYKKSITLKRQLKNMTYSMST